MHFIPDNRIKIKYRKYEKTLPAALLFNALSFDCGGNSAENEKFYTSNIKITKEKTMKYVFVIIFTIAILNLNAQPVQNPGWKELQEKVIGWDKALPPYGNAVGKSTTVQGRTFSSYQMGLIDTFTNWIKKSYIPVGGLPQQERLALPDGVENRPYVPKGTGVSMAMWGPCYDATGKKIIQAQPASADRITILTNHIKGVEPAVWFSTPSQYYFTMYYDTKGKLVNEEDEQKNVPYVNEIKSKIGDYFVYFTGKTVNVMLMPGKELPLVQITKAEVLDKAEEGIRRMFADKYVKQLDTRSIENINTLRNKYKNSLQQPAFVNISQLSTYSFSGGVYDVFEKMVNSPYMYPVYKINPAMYELCDKDKPQWISISFPYATEKSATARWEIFKAMTNNFNYQYIYDYFFNPDNVKGKSYQPRQTVSQAAATDKIESRDNIAKQTKTFAEGVHFIEDFADAQSGTMPAGWTSKQNNRGFVIETPAGKNGKWLFMDSGSDIIPSSMKKPMPANFTLEFDLVCTDYTSRTGRTVTINLSNNSTTVSLFITPGNEQNIYIYPSMSGFRMADKNTIGYHNIEFASYSNKKNMAHIKIVKSGTSIKAFVNSTKVESDPKYKQDYDKEMKLPDNTVFNILEWKSDTVAPTEDKGKVYISNIKIIKD